MGFARRARKARQLVGHRHFAGQRRPDQHPVVQLKPGDKVEVRESRRSREPFKTAKETLKNHQAPEAVD